MKNILVLGGNSNKNINWTNRIKDFYSKNYNVSVVEYDNWKDNSDMDFDIELEKIKKVLLNNNYDIILAKSIGVVIICYLSRSINLNNKKIVFMGYPKYLLDKENINIKDDIYKINDNNNLVLIQQENDMLCSYKILKKEFNNIKLLKVDGNDHSYNDILNNDYLNEFINKL